MNDVVILFSLCAIATIATRFGGHLILARFNSIHPRVEAALDAVPSAVMTALVAPYLVSHSWAETVTLIVTILLARRLPLVLCVFVGLALLVMLRMI